MIAARRLASVASHRMITSASGASFNRRRISSVTNNKPTETLNLRRRAGNYSTTAGSTTPADRNRPELDVSLLVSVLQQENATNICVIRVAPELRYTGHMIIASGSSPRHLNAMATLVLKVFKFLRTEEQRHTRLEGRECDDWKCIDLGSVVLHLLLPELRSVYELEKLWTLRSLDEQLVRAQEENTLPPDFIWDDSPAPPCRTHAELHTPHTQ